MFRIIKNFIKQNKLEILISLLIFTNLFPAWCPKFLYYLGLLLILVKAINTKKSANKKVSLFYIFIGCIWLSSIIGMSLDLRLVIFTTILYISLPSCTLKWHLYKIKLLYCIFMGFGIATLVNFYAKINGINMIVQDEFSRRMGRIAEFSGFANYAMWTSCAAAMSTLYFVSMSFRDISKSKITKLFHFIMILISLYITLISASRSAFFLALLCSTIIIVLQSRKKTVLVRNICIIGITSILFAPFLIKNSGAMMHKKNGLEITVENTSRDALWSQRIAEFKSSPIFGIGFAAHGVGINKQVGRNESGGSFISVLAQAGIVGFTIVLLIWYSATMLPYKVGRNPNMILLYGSFIFMSIHSIIEGYMFQAGWYMCLIIWLVVGVMIEHKTLSKKHPQLMEENI